VQAIGWSLLRALPVPVLLAATAHRLRQLPEIGSGVEILSAVFFSLSVWWLAGHLLLLISSRNGIGTVHFAWNPVILKRLRRHLAWFLPSQLLVILSIALAFGHPSDDVRDVFGRMGLLAAVLLSGWFAWHMLAPLPDPVATPNADRKRRMARLALTAFALALALLTLAGYLLTVGEMLQRAINTGVVLAAVWLGYSLAARALVLSEARLQLQRMREQRAKAAVLETAAQVGEGAVIDVPEPHLSLENINLQTRTLLRVTTGAAVVLALFWVWADILPALTWLERVTLWSRTIVVGETEILSRVSLQDFLLAIFLGVLFTLAARNLPGLVEILLSRSTRMDAAGRYTITTLLRYLLAVVAVISVFSLLGLRWSELQWMVAALTLGLGFGLQEVVANFVSGIIMLFERPVRVGDTITIGEYSGTVTKIRTRATTIMDWDNREIVVPNKAFITERLINWTLSDTMTRIVIPVGVSYDADVDAVIATLGEIARAHPTVMADPAPTVFFLSFGDSTLNFELRVYVSQMKERLVTISDLHRAIIREFRIRGIEIAYPQMDLHLRDMVPIPSPAAGGRDGSTPGATPAS
jgi:potassium-dependent mechanosensitive channel